MTDSLTISAIIPTHNRPDLLRVAIESVLGQTVLPQEIIVVDDASTVSYAETLALFAQAAVPVRYHRNAESGGPSGARNAGAGIAKGDILMFLDDDDTWLPIKIANQMAVFAAQPEVGLVYSGRRVINKEGELQYHINPRVSGHAHRALLAGNGVGTTSSVAIRRDIFEAAGGFDPDLSRREDQELWVRAAKLAPIAYDPEHTVNYLVLDSVVQCSQDPQSDERAGLYIFAKHAAEYAAMSFVERRRAWAWHYATVADKYARIRSGRAYWYALRSVLQFPSCAALSRLLPRALWVRLRGILRR